MLSFIIGPPTPFDGPVAKVITRIKRGEPDLRDEFIARYKPFIMKSVLRMVGNKYIQIENSEEYSIGLMAFNEAIDCYDETKHRNFFDFAKQVIKRRIINYWESNKSKTREYPFTYFEDESQENQGYLETIPSPTPHFTKNYEVKEEIQLYKEQLAEFGITLRDLVSSSPKHIDSRQLAIKIARIISVNDDIFEQMVKRKALPIFELLKIANVNKRTLERHRKFIIAICLILRSELEILKDYINQAERRGN